jgi:hypothetical protein
MPSINKRKQTLKRLQLLVPPKINKAVRQRALDRGTYPSVIGVELLAQALGMNGNDEPSNGASNPTTTSA